MIRVLPQVKNLTTEDTEFHGENMVFEPKPPCRSVSSVVIKYSESF